MGRKKKSDRLDNTALIALSKLVDERVGEGAPLIVVGWLDGIFLCGALAQLAVGRLIERGAAPSVRRRRDSAIH